MGITAQRNWRRKQEAIRRGAPPAAAATEQLPAFLPRERHEQIVREVRKGYELQLGALRATSGDDDRQVVATSAEAQALIDRAKEEFDAWANEVREEAAKVASDAREELAQARTLLEQVAKERDELAALLEQATSAEPEGDASPGADAPAADGAGGSTPEAEAPPPTQPDAAPAEAGAPPAENAEAKPPEPSQPEGKGGKGSRRGSR